MRRVLVTGGAGFIGTAAVSALTEAGLEVVVLDSLRPDVHHDSGRPHPADLVVGDVRDAEVLDRVLPGVDAVVHLAAKVGLGVDIADMADYVSSNDLGTAVLLRRCAAAGVTGVVQASSMVVYGEGRYTCCDPRCGPARASQR